MKKLTESKELHEKIDKILQRVESMDNFMPWLIRPQAQDIRDGMMAIFKTQLSAGNVFLKIDGEKSVSEIAQELDLQLSNTSREIGKLVEMGLVEPKSISSKSVYKKTKIDKIIGLSKPLQKFLSDQNGKKKRN